MPRGKAPEWRGPEEVPVAEMGASAKRTERRQFLYDVMLRLERTSNDRALRYLFNDKAGAVALVNYMHHYLLRTRGKGQLCTAVRQMEDGRVAVYVTRGPNYKQGVPE